VTRKYGGSKDIDDQLNERTPEIQTGIKDINGKRILRKFGEFILEIARELFVIEHQMKLVSGVLC
jgi:hypothetical protein